MKPEETSKILEANYEGALEMSANATSHQISNDIKTSVDIFIEKIDTDKSLV